MGNYNDTMSEKVTDSGIDTSVKSTKIFPRTGTPEVKRRCLSFKRQSSRSWTIVGQTPVGTTSSSPSYPLLGDKDSTSCVLTLPNLPPQGSKGCPLGFPVLLDGAFSNSCSSAQRRSSFVRPVSYLFSPVISGPIVQRPFH